MTNNVKLELKGISKTFGSIKANTKVDLKLHEGEILAILGENGSGKTTLMNMIAGIYFPDEGQIFIDGKEVTIHSPKDAYNYKIGMIHQHFKLVDVFSASENIVLGVETKAKYDINEVNDAVAAIAERYGFIIDPKKKVHEMSVSEKQTVEIIKVLYRGADILILDEPTAVLTPQEIDKLFSVLRKMKEDGKSIIIITHKLNEVKAISDNVTVLLKGKYVDTVKTADSTESQLTELMVGKKVTLNIDRTEPNNPTDRLVVDNLCSTNEEGIATLDHISFTARSGEILGIAGIAGSGQKELLEAIAGLQKIDAGTVLFNNPKKDKPVTYIHKSYKKVCQLASEGKFHYEDGTKVDFTGMKKKDIVALVNDGKVLFNEDEVIDLRDKTPLEIRELGVRLSFVPEDRLGMGLVGSMDITNNMMLRSYRKGKSFLLNRKNPEALAEEIVHDLEVVTPSIKTPVRRLSGGNIQKVLVGREISYAPKVFMAAYPVRGLDINSSYMIYNLLNKQKESGAAILFVGEDLDVLLELSDRILVINAGKVTGIVDARTTTKEEVGLLMTKHEGINETKEVQA
ncbi:MAG: ABC transporter ATP-binding protein [Clostridia bacterium]|nr:ABC transporter ATP-binding protein [Clostridia bacterium]